MFDPGQLASLLDVARTLDLLALDLDGAHRTRSACLSSLGFHFTGPVAADHARTEGAALADVTALARSCRRTADAIAAEWADATWRWACHAADRRPPSDDRPRPVPPRPAIPTPPRFAPTFDARSWLREVR